MVRAIAALSVLASAATLVLTDVATGDPLPVQTINLSVIAGGAAVMAVLLQRFTPDNNLWRVLLLIAVVGPVAMVFFAVARSQAGPPPALVGAVWLLDVALAVPWMLFFGLFPDGHRPIRRWPALVLGSTLILAAVTVVAWLTAPDGAPLPVPGHLPGVVGTSVEGGDLHAVAARTSSALVGVLPLVAALCLALRYPRSGPLVRQQIRVGAVGLSAGVLLEVALRTLPGVEAGKVHFAHRRRGGGASGAFGVAAALLRWRLWMVDQALPRAVVLGCLLSGFHRADGRRWPLIATGRPAPTGPGRRPRRGRRDHPRPGLQPPAGALGARDRLRQASRRVRRAGRARRRVGGGRRSMPRRAGSPTRLAAAWRCPGRRSGHRPRARRCSASWPRPASVRHPRWSASSRTEPVRTAPRPGCSRTTRQRADSQGTRGVGLLSAGSEAVGPARRRAAARRAADRRRPRAADGHHAARPSSPTPTGGCSDEVAASLEELQTARSSCRSRASGWSPPRTRSDAASSATSTTVPSTS